MQCSLKDGRNPSAIGKDVKSIKTPTSEKTAFVDLDKEGCPGGAPGRYAKPVWKLKRLFDQLCLCKCIEFAGGLSSRQTISPPLPASRGNLVLAVLPNCLKLEVFGAQLIYNSSWQQVRPLQNTLGFPGRQPQNSCNSSSLMDQAEVPTELSLYYREPMRTKVILTE